MSVDLMLACAAANAARDAAWAHEKVSTLIRLCTPSHWPEVKR